MTKRLRIEYQIWVATFKEWNLKTGIGLFHFEKTLKMYLLYHTIQLNSIDGSLPEKISHLIIIVDSRTGG